MNPEFFDAIAQIEQEKGIPQDYMLDRIAQALTAAYRRTSGVDDEKVVVLTDPKEKTITMFVQYDVVAEIEDLEEPDSMLTIDEARAIDPNAEVGGVVRKYIDVSKFGRIAAQTAKQVIIQGIREAERGMMLREYESKTHELVSGTVLRINQKNGNAYLDIGNNRDGATDAVLPPAEQIAGETVREGQRIRVYVVEARATTRGPQVMVSRTHPGLVKRLFELEVPEIHDGTVEIKSIAREAGSRTKIAVWANDENVDPIGSCVGPKGARVEHIVDELGGEKIDIIKYSDSPEEYIAAALSPAEVVSVTMLEDGKSCTVIVPADQLSLAIGKEGQNARLVARLTGFKIDIKPAE